jgi:hypothetical protein
LETRRFHDDGERSEILFMAYAAGVVVFGGFSP